MQLQQHIYLAHLTDPLDLRISASSIHKAARFIRQVHGLSVLLPCTLLSVRRAVAYLLVFALSSGRDKALNRIRSRGRSAADSRQLAPLVGRQDGDRLPATSRFNVVFVIFVQLVSISNFKLGP
jgi:hypothetical protein